MATLKACVQKMRNDGFYPVYIRVTHNRTTQYIKTDKMVTKRELSRSKDITDPVVMKFCAKIGMNYASCSPFRVPIARLAAAQAAVEE